GQVANMAVRTAHTLPFAESFMPGQSGDGSAFESFCRRVGYPLVAKQRRGTSSGGVYFVRDRHDAEAIGHRPGYGFQESVGDPGSLERFFAPLQGPPPLLAQFTKAGYHVCHTVIAPSSEITPVAVTENFPEYGHATSNRRVVDPTLDALTVDYARALSLEGGAGPVNLQLRQNRDGSWKVIEINLGNTGGT